MTCAVCACRGQLSTRRSRTIRITSRSSGNASPAPMGREETCPARCDDRRAHPTVRVPTSTTPIRNTGPETWARTTHSCGIARVEVIFVARHGSAWHWARWSIVLVKNNRWTVRRGLRHGENPPDARITDLGRSSEAWTPFMVTRPAARPRSKEERGSASRCPACRLRRKRGGPGTTFNRPNTRDGTPPAQFRRLHVIGGDGNMSSPFLRFGTTPWS